MSLNFETLTGFTYRGLAPHKFTPLPGVHNSMNPTPRIGLWFTRSLSAARVISTVKDRNNIAINLDKIIYWWYS
jgi:hypothetical protein